MTINEIIKRVEKLNCNLVEITGGEPLLQNGHIELIKKLEQKNYFILLETGGALPINDIPKKTHIILDLKCPSSNMEDKNLWENLDFIKKKDEVKFVIGDRNDYRWTKKIIKNLQKEVIFGRLIKITYPLQKLIRFFQVHLTTITYLV